MKKADRQDLIGQLLSERRFYRQQELQAALKEAGVEVTQATLSRDMKELKVERHIPAQGPSFYRLPRTGPETSLGDVALYVKRVDRVEFSLVLHTGLGEASVLANSLDASGDRRILGTIAGADTLLVVTRSSQDGASLEEDIRSYVEEAL